MLSMNGRVVLVALLATAVCASLSQAASHKRDLNSRQKRSFSWLPPFLGGGSSDTPAEEEEDAPAEGRIQNGGVHVPIAGPYQDPNFVGRIIQNGQLVDNKLHYPIWRVHKYNGVHLQPLPVSLVHDPSAVQSVVQTNEQTTEEEDSDDSLPPITSEVATWLTPELIQMARQFGVTDFSRVPSLSEAMDALGTSTKNETIEVIKEFASTQNGRALIKQFVEGQNDSDNEVAASENVETVENAENTEHVENAENLKIAENAENVENLKNIENPENARALTESEYEAAMEHAQYVEALKNLGISLENYGAGAAGDNEGASTMMIAQYLYPPLQSQLIEQVAKSQLTGSGPAQTEKQSANEYPDTEVETTTSASLFGRITQWANFLNPLTNREEIPIPPVEVDVKESNTPAPYTLNNEYIKNQDTIKIPDLPELPALPQLPGEEHPLPPLPEIHIPNRYISPNAGNINNGHYVRVKIPLAGFNPTPQLNIDPKYLQFARNQLSIPNAPTTYVPFAGPQKPIQVYHQIGATVGQPTAGRVYVNQPAQVAQPVYVDQQAQLIDEIANLEVPSFEAIPFRPVVAVAAPYQHIGQLPVEQIANYEVFRNAPRIVDSQGAPAPPYTYEHNGLPNSYYVSPHANAVYIQQEYEVPAASEIVERKVKPDESSEEDSVESEEIANNSEQRMQIVVEDENKKEEEEQVAEERSNENDKITLDADHKNENNQSKQSEQSQQLVEPEQKVIDIGEKSAEVTKETDATANPSIYNNLRPVLMATKASIEKRSNFKRQASHEQATGKVFRADPKSMDLLPYTVRHMVKSTQTTNEKPE